MQRTDEGKVQGAGVDRRLDIGAVYVHNNHLQGGFRAAVGCRVCKEGLGGFTTAVEEERAGDQEDGVAESDGADKSGDAAPSPSDGATAGRDGDKVLEW